MEQNVLGIKVRALYWCILEIVSLWHFIHVHIFSSWATNFIFPYFPNSPPFNVFLCVAQLFRVFPNNFLSEAINCLPRKVVLNLWVTTLAGGSHKTIKKYIFCDFRNCDTSALSISRHVQPHNCQVYWAFPWRQFSALLGYSSSLPMTAAISLLSRESWALILSLAQHRAKPTSRGSLVIENFSSHFC